MNANIEKRLEDLEKQCEDRPKVKLLWYNEIHEPPKAGVTRIKFQWLEEIQHELCCTQSPRGNIGE